MLHHKKTSRPCPRAVVENTETSHPCMVVMSLSSLWIEVHCGSSCAIPWPSASSKQTWGIWLFPARVSHLSWVQLQEWAKRSLYLLCLITRAWVFQNHSVLRYVCSHWCQRQCNCIWWCGDWYLSPCSQSGRDWKEFVFPNPKLSS